MDPSIRQVTVRAGDRGTAQFACRGGPKDRYTLEEVWTKHPYVLKNFRVARRLFIDEEYARIVGDGGVPLIIDAGANIGASAVQFAFLYPKARIVAVEPESGNFALLEANSRDFPSILPVQGAVANADGELELFDPGVSTDGYRARAGDPEGACGASLGAVAAFSMQTLKNRFGEGATPLLAKIDIEGGEAELFASNTGWVADYPAIALELHDWMLPGSASAAPFLRCVGELGRDFLCPIGVDVVYSLRN